MDESTREELSRLRRKWRSPKDGGVYSFNSKDLRTFEEIMVNETGYDFLKLRTEFDFRFSGAIVRPAPPNMDNSVLTVTTGQRHKHALPGGKMDVTRIPFTAFLFADFWVKNKNIYTGILSTSDGSKVPLVGILNRDEGVRKYVTPLDDLLVKLLDKPFEDAISEIRIEGFRELREELGLERVGRRDEMKMKESGKELIDSSSGEKLAYNLGAVPVGLFLDSYRVSADNEEARKKFFVAFDYLMEVRGDFDMIDRTIKNHLRREDANEREIAGIRWASLAEVIGPGYDHLYHDDVHYFARRVAVQKGVIVDPRYGFIGGSTRRDTEESKGDVVLPVPFSNGSPSGHRGGSPLAAANSKR